MKPPSPVRLAGHRFRLAAVARPCALAAALVSGALVAGAGMASGAAAQPGPGVRFAVPPPGTLSQPPNVVYGIEQDAAGYLWVASEQGLHRYDGVEFTAFRADPGDPGALPGNRVTAVSVAPGGDVWAAVDRFGLVRYDADTRRFQRFRLPEALARDPHVVVDADAAVWVTGGGWEIGPTADAGAPVYRLDAERRTLARVEGLRPSVWGLVLDGRRRLWVIEDDALVERRAGGWRRHRLGAVSVVRGTPLRAVRGDELLALGPSGRFRAVRPETAAARAGLATTLGALRGGASSLPLVDRGGRLWVSTDEGSLQALDLATGRSVTYAYDPLRPESLPDGIVSELYESRDGVLWIGGAQGLRTLAPGWDVFQATPLGRVRFATVLALGSSGRLWGGVACEPFGEVRPDGSVVPLAQAEPAVAAAIARAGLCVSNVLEARDGTFWIAGWPFPGTDDSAGVLRVRPDGTARHYLPVPGDSTSLRHAATRLVHEDAAGRIWVATEAGLSRLDASGDAFTTFDAQRGGLATDVIWSLADGPGGRLWVGTYGGGLSLFDPQTETARTWRHDPADAATLPSDIITAVLPSRAEPGVVWVGTYDGGLARFVPSTGRVRRFGRADGLPSFTVKSLVEAPDGALWVGTDAGLLRLDVRSGAARVYTEADGLPGANLGLYDAALLPDGRLAVATQADLVTFDPARTEPFRIDADVVLRALRIEGTLRALPPRGEGIRLAPGERAVGVELAALSFRAPQRLRYAVRLDGVDERWLPLGADRSAAWAGLAPGTYTLRARVGVSSGTWSRSELAVPVVVAPTWWQRRAVRGLAFLLAVGLFGLAIRDLSQRRLRRQVQALEVARRLQHERERISRDLHDHVGAQLSSLLAGVELARLARRRGTTPPGLGDPLDAVEDDARATMRQLRETIWALHGQAVSLGAFCERARADLAARAPAGLATDVSCHGEPGAVLSPMQALNLYRIVQEAVTNVLKYAHAHTLSVHVAHDGTTVRVEVSDDGAFRAAPGGDGAVSPGAALSGFGLRSMAARAEALGGTFALDTSSGTTVRVAVPAEPPDALPASGEAGAAVEAAP